MSAAESQQFGKYQLLERIAVGGMAEIYRARYAAAADVVKPVVIKKILPHYAGNPSFIKMFVNEAKIAVGLSHGNIAQVFDFGAIDGEYFLAMELVEGQPLSRILRRSTERAIPRVPVPFALLVGIELLKGLHYAHTRVDEEGRPLKIVHRDVSPQNILVSYEGQVKIVDFGIAKARMAGQVETQAGAVKGKYFYFAPEQALGKELDARTDVFATAIVLYEMVCGRRPYEGKMMEVLGKIALGNFPRPRELNPALSPALETILLKAMSTEREERYPSAEAFADALSGYLHADEPAFPYSGVGGFVTFLFEEDLRAAARPSSLPEELRQQFTRLQAQSGRPLPSSKSKSGEAKAGGSGPQPAARNASSQPRVADDRKTMEIPADQEGPTLQVQTPHEEIADLASPSRPGTPTVDLSGMPERHALNSNAAAESLRAGSSGARETNAGNGWMYVVVPLVAACLAAVAVFAFGFFRTFSVQLSSTPPGAQVRVDGVHIGSNTPVRISDLSTDRAHRIELSAPGMASWSGEIPPHPGKTVTVHVKLRPVGSSTASPQPGDQAEGLPNKD